MTAVRRNSIFWDSLLTEEALNALISQNNEVAVLTNDHFLL